MPELSSLMTFALIALGMVLTPGPNMVYLISRSISQARGGSDLSGRGGAGVCLLSAVRSLRDHGLSNRCAIRP